MPERIAIIDIGSNSARLVIFQETSKHGFHLVSELKSRVRIGEGAYENGGNLQPAGLNRAYSTLQSFSQTISEFKVSKTVAVATSALRDAPNKSIFLDKIEQDLGIKIEVIDGKDEAFLGAIAANNLLPASDGITIDIGGGSTDLALISKGKIVDNYSLDIGTVRLKELFFDKSKSIDDAKKYIDKALPQLPDSFHSNTAIAIGGTVRALAKAIMTKTKYPLNKLHAFSYKYEDHYDFFYKIVHSDIDKLDKLYIKQNRHDTIREGTLIFMMVLDHIGAADIMTSGAGVREGVYLKDKYTKPNYKIPKNINPSIRSIRDRFDILSLPYGNKKRVARSLYDLFADKFDSKRKYMNLLEDAVSLSDIGKILTIYHKEKHASYIAMEELNYGYTHEEMILISLLLYSKPKRGYHKEMYKQYKTLLPGKKIVRWLAFIYTLTMVLHQVSTRAKYRFLLKGNRLTISSNTTLYLAYEEISDMKKPSKLEIVLD